MSVYDHVLLFLVCGFVTNCYVHVDKCANSNKRPIVTWCEAIDTQSAQDASFAQINSKKQPFTAKELFGMNKIQKNNVQEGETNAPSEKKFDARQASQFGYDAKKKNINLLQRSQHDSGQRRKTPGKVCVMHFCRNK